MARFRRGSRRPASKHNVAGLHHPRIGPPDPLRTATTTVASLYYLTCEHRFAGEVFPSEEDQELDEAPLGRARAPHIASIFRCLPGS
jgi:hypothetical protein